MVSEVYQGPGQLGYVNGRAVRTRDTGMKGIIFHRDTPILPRDPPDARRAKPRFSVADLAGALGPSASCRAIFKNRFVDYLLISYPEVVYSINH